MENQEEDGTVGKEENDAMNGIDGEAQNEQTANENQTGQNLTGQGQPPSPFNDFYVVELEATGIGKNTSLFESHIMNAFYRLNKEQKAKLEYIKVKFYRECAKLATFRLDRKYVLHRNRLKVLMEDFKEIQADFVETRNVIFKDLNLNWDKIVDEVYVEHPRFPITKEKLVELRPESPTFAELEAHPIQLEAFVASREGLSALFSMSGEENSATSLMLTKIKLQYQEKIKDMEERVEKLKKVVKKKGIRYEKSMYELGEEKEKIEEIADLLGEKDSASMKLEGMLEHLAENVSKK